MLAAALVATKTSVVRYRHRTTSSGRTRDIHTSTSFVAFNSKEIVLDPSLDHDAWRAPTQVGGGADSTTGAAATGTRAAAGVATGVATGCGDAAGCHDCSRTNAIAHRSTPAPPTRRSDRDFV